ncbi:MAG: hypothetical protein WC378_08825 [Opitutaceae bacterium]|jgi:hypothetical protein
MSTQNSSPQDAHHPSAKQALVLDDALYPMPRARMVARDILDQTGASADVVLKRDYNSTIDHIFADDEEVDLRQGNVFKTVPRCAPAPCNTPDASPKLAFVVDDAWEASVNPHQTGHSLKRLMGLPDGAKLMRDFESPIDQPITDDEKVIFQDGPVFTVKDFSLTIKVNNNKVTVGKRRMTGLEIKQAAIAEKVKIEISFVLYQLDKDGNLGPAIADDKIIVLHHCDAFRCVAPDDNS